MLKPGLLLILVLATVACGGGDSRDVSTVGEAAASSQDFKVTTTAFREGGRIPARNTCDGEDRSIPVSWSGAPEETAAFAILFDDPDAPGGTFKHWMIFNIQPATTEIPESVDKVEKVLNTALQIRNDFGKSGYGGPCPPEEQAHRYRLFLYALDAMLDLNAVASQSAVLNGIDEHAIARSEISGVYSR